MAKMTLIVITTQISVAAVNASKVLKVYSEIWRLCAVSSSTPMESIGKPGQTRV